MSQSSGQETDPEFKPFTKAERIQQLNDIDKSIAQLLQSAGLALKTLTDSQSSTSSRREAFQDASETYLKTLQKADIGMKRQIWGLEEADIIPADKAKKEREGKDPLAKSTGEQAVSEMGTMGKLDIGWLNSRSGRVERDMEGELWEKARKFLEGQEGKRENEDGDVDMES